MAIVVTPYGILILLLAIFLPPLGVLLETGLSKVTDSCIDSGVFPARLLSRPAFAPVSLPSSHCLLPCSLCPVLQDFLINVLLTLLVSRRRDRQCRSPAMISSAHRPVSSAPLVARAGLHPGHHSRRLRHHDQPQQRREVAVRTITAVTARQCGGCGDESSAALSAAVFGPVSVLSPRSRESNIKVAATACASVIRQKAAAFAA